MVARARRPMATSGCFSSTSKRFGRQHPPEQPRHMPQQPPRRRQRQRPPALSSGHDPPAVQRRRHPPRQHPVGRDQRHLAPVLRRLPQDQRDRHGLGPGVRRLDQGDMPAVASTRSGRPGPSASHCRSPARGASDSEISRFRAGSGAVCAGPGPDVARAGAQPRRSARESGTADDPRPSARRPGPPRPHAGMSQSNPGRTTAPCGSRATACISSAVVPRDPVDPATITGCGGRRLPPSAPPVAATAIRCRAGSSGASPAKNGSDDREEGLRPRPVRRVVRDIQRRRSRSGPTPSPCISSISAPGCRPDRKAPRAARCPAARSISRATSCASSSRRRSGDTAAGRRRGPGSSTRLGHQPQPGQQAAPRRRPAPRAPRAASARCSGTRRPAPGLGRLPRTTAPAARREVRREIRAGRQAEQPGRVALTASRSIASASAMLSGRPTSHHPP